MDIVCFELKESKGAMQALAASSIKNFSEAADARAAKPLCRKEGALVHLANYEIDEGDLLELSRRNGALVFALSDVLRERGFRRGILISKMRLLLAACRKRCAAFVFATLANDEGQMRSARELSAFAAVLGATDVERKGAEKRMKQIAGAGGSPAQGERKEAEKKPDGVVEK
jgi:hypothetical protein